MKRSNFPGRVNQRRAGSKERLEVQLNKGTKTEKKSSKKVKLTEKDIERIKEQLAILNKRTN